MSVIGKASSKKCILWPKLRGFDHLPTVKNQINPYYYM